MLKLPNILLTTLVGITVYIIVSKLFPETLADKNDLRGGDFTKNQIVNSFF